MRSRSLVMWIGSTLLLAGVVSAGQPTLTVQFVPERFGLEDVARLEIVVEGGRPEGAAPRPESLHNLQIVGGPSVSQQFSLVNGVSSSSVTYTYLVRASSVGKVVVGPVKVTVDGSVLSSDAIEAQAVQGSVMPPRRAGPTNPFDPFSELMGPQRRRAVRVVLRLLPERRSLVHGEPLAVTIVLDTTAAVEGFEWSAPPAFPGWWSQRIEQEGPLEGQPVKVDGVRFMRYSVGRYVLIPLSSGTLKLPTCCARIGVRGPGFFSSPQVVERNTGEAVKIEVRELPKPPAGFHGAVGSLRYRAQLEPRHVKQGEASTLVVTLAGSGNLPLAEPPFPWPAPEGCQVYPPEESSSVEVKPTGPTGKRVWKAVVLPNQPGTYYLEAVQVAVFDPAKGRYRGQSLGPFELEVEAPPATPTPSPTPLPEDDQSSPTSSSGQATPSVISSGQPMSIPVLLGLVAIAGALAGGVVTLLLLRRRNPKTPRRRKGEHPADRARALQGALEGWWHGLDEAQREEPDLKREVDRLRRDLEAVRFAPGRADHTETVAELEARLRKLLSSA